MRTYCGKKDKDLKKFLDSRLERRFQRTKVSCLLWNLYAKFVRIQSSIGRLLRTVEVVNILRIHMHLLCKVLVLAPSYSQQVHSIGNFAF